MRFIFLILLLTISGQAAAQTPSFQSDALSLERLVNEQYAYLDGLPQGRFELTAKLRDEAEAVSTKRDLIRFAERALNLLADHHAITGASLSDSWAVFPSFGDMWIEQQGTAYLITQVRKNSPAAAAGIKAGDWLVGVDGVSIDKAVERFWANLGAMGGEQRNSFAARVLAAGRRDRPRSLLIRRDSAEAKAVTLPNLYTLPNTSSAPIFTSENEDRLHIKFNNSLGDRETIAAFDTAMAKADPAQQIVLDLTDTPSGGNTTVARAVMGWFVTRPTAYQMHSLPAEERETGIPRQWIEQVLPRSGKQHGGSVIVKVGRWTGSMGEGMAIGFSAIGARIVGTRMAGLRGAIEDYRLGSSDLVIKLPTERLYTVSGIPREDFVPSSAFAE